MAFTKYNITTNGLGVPTTARPMPTEEQVLRDTLDVLRNSLRMMEDEPDLAAECAEVRASIRSIEEHLSRTAEAERVIPAGRCPICGLSLTEHPHSEAECAEWFAEDYRDAEQTRADLWQF